MSKPTRQTHFAATVLFLGLALFAAVRSGSDASGRWQPFAVLAAIAAAVAGFRLFSQYRRDAGKQQESGEADTASAFPEGQARLIDSGHLPNRYNAGIDLKDAENCHFAVPAQRIFFTPLPAHWQVDPARLLARYSGGSFYYIVRPQEILLPAEVDDKTDGQLVITNQRIIFQAAENGFEIQLQSLKLLDCSAHLVDFQVSGRRYTLQTDAACYAEKVLMLILQPPG